VMLTVLLTIVASLPFPPLWPWIPSGAKFLFFLYPPMATPNCPTYGRSNCSRQDGWIMTIPG